MNFRLYLCNQSELHMINIVVFLIDLKCRQANFFFLIGIFRTVIFTSIINTFGLESTMRVPVSFSLGLCFIFIFLSSLV